MTGGERKIVTALFADIKGSTELMRDLEPEEARAIVDPVLQLMMSAVHRYDGYVAQSTGDGIFAMFGAPVAHEDHAQRALHAALAMQDELHHYREKTEALGRLPLEARIGINTGEVVLRMVNTGAQTEYSPVGHAANLAARLQTVAPAGGVIVSDDTRKLVEDYFEMRHREPATLRGISEPVNIYEVIRAGAARGHFDVAARRGLTKFVGREHELAQIRRALELAMDRHGQLVALVAEAGAGKSRLVYEFKPLVPSRCKLLEAYSVSYGKASGWLPVLELLRNHFRIETADDAATRREKVRTAVAALDPGLNDTLPYLWGLLGIQEMPDPLAQMDPQVRHNGRATRSNGLSLGRVLLSRWWSSSKTCIGSTARRRLYSTLWRTASPMRGYCCLSTTGPSIGISGPKSRTTHSCGWNR
jgi:class 3 adenylate cyclase